MHGTALLTSVGKKQKKMLELDFLFAVKYPEYLGRYR
jgi:hypothetical protein